VDGYARKSVSVFAHHTGNQGHVVLLKFMTQTVNGNGEESRVGQDHFFHAVGSRIMLIQTFGIPIQFFQYVGQTNQESLPDRSIVLFLTGLDATVNVFEQIRQILHILAYGSFSVEKYEKELVGEYLSFGSKSEIDEMILFVRSDALNNSVNCHFPND
jgi:hypothetical protein